MSGLLDGWDRDTVLPWAYEVKNGVRSPNGQLAVPGLLADAWNAVKAVGSAPLLGPIQRPSQMAPEALDEMLGHVGAVVGWPMAGVGMARGAMLPRGVQELGSSGGKVPPPLPPELAALMRGEIVPSAPRPMPSYAELEAMLPKKRKIGTPEEEAAKRAALDAQLAELRKKMAPKTQ